MDKFDSPNNLAEPVNVIPVIETMPADLLTPLAVYLKLSADEETSFLFESVEGGEALGRYSFIGTKPDEIVRGNAYSSTILKAGCQKHLKLSPMDYLRQHFARYRIAGDAELAGFSGGAIAIFNFACARWFEPKLNEALPAGDDHATLLFFRSIVAFDHIRQEIKIVSLVFADEIEGEETRLDQALADASARNRKIRQILENRPVQIPRKKIRRQTAEISSNWRRSDFLAAVGKIKDAIYAGDAYQVVLSQRFERKTTASPIAIYRAIRSINPSPYMFLIADGTRPIIGASPEMLVRLRGNLLEYRPIAGTRPRDADAAKDAHLAADMLADEKEIAEHMMLVDLGRNDLGRVAEYGTVKVERLMSIEKYSHVQHLVSALSAFPREGFDRFDAFAACFPAGTVSGAPKVRAIEIISELEPTPRGVYSGAIGYFDYSGNMDTCIAIRTMTLEDGVARVQAGAGIVADSIPENEYEETVNKAKALLGAIDSAERSENEDGK